jgi:hypothetical protein
MALCIPVLPHSYYMPCSSNAPWLDHSNYVWRTSYEAPHYAVFSNLLSLISLRAKYFSSTPCSQTPSVYVPQSILLHFVYYHNSPNTHDTLQQAITSYVLYNWRYCHVLKLKLVVVVSRNCIISEPSFYGYMNFVKVYIIYTQFSEMKFLLVFLRVILPRSLVRCYQFFGAICCLQLQDTYQNIWYLSRQ